MGKFLVLLCDSDEVYVKRLAAGLRRQFREQVTVQTCTSLDVPLREGDSGSLQQMGNRNSIQQMASPGVLVTSQCPETKWREGNPGWVCLWLDDGVEKQKEKKEIIKKIDEEAVIGTRAGLTTSQDSGIWQGRIQKYQSVSKIAKALQQYLPQEKNKRPIPGTCKTQEWYGVVSPVRHESMLPFACSLAGTLSKERKVLLVVLMEFPGLCQWLGLAGDVDVTVGSGIEAGLSMDSFLYQLRKEDRLERIPFPFVRKLQEFDLLMGPENPMVLYELNEQDISRLIERMQLCQEYDAVVWVAGNMLCGIRELFGKSEKIFSVEKNDPYSCCCQKEFAAFFEKLKLENEDSLMKVNVPVIKGMQTGEHLLWQWEHSAIGEQTRRLLEGEEVRPLSKGEETDGTLGGAFAKKDFRTTECEW